MKLNNCNNSDNNYLFNKNIVFSLYFNINKLSKNNKNEYLLDDNNKNESNFFEDDSMLNDNILQELEDTENDFTHFPCVIINKSNNKKIITNYIKSTIPKIDLKLIEYNKSKYRGEKNGYTSSSSEDKEKSLSREFSNDKKNDINEKISMMKKNIEILSKKLEYKQFRHEKFRNKIEQMNIILSNYNDKCLEKVKSKLKSKYQFQSNLISNSKNKKYLIRNYFSNNIYNSTTDNHYNNL